MMFMEVIGKYPPPMGTVLADPGPLGDVVTCLDLGCGSGSWYNSCFQSGISNLTKIKGSSMSPATFLTRHVLPSIWYPCRSRKLRDQCCICTLSLILLLERCPQIAGANALMTRGLLYINLATQERNRRYKFGVTTFLQRLQRRACPFNCLRGELLRLHSKSRIQSAK
jgi:hypothetical protein